MDTVLSILYIVNEQINYSGIIIYLNVKLGEECPRANTIVSTVKIRRLHLFVATQRFRQALPPLVTGNPIPIVRNLW